MVKIKDDYVMSPRERENFERMDALPRKAYGKVEYYYKPQTKYPPRVYVFMHAEIWQDRNRRPMGLFHAMPFLSRPMNREEIEYHHFDTRLCYHQYEQWEKLLYAERQEADELDKETPGTGTAFYERLQEVILKYPLCDAARFRKIDKPLTLTEAIDFEELRLVDLLTTGSLKFTVGELGQALHTEQGGKQPQSNSHCPSPFI